jgi:hypothetical protein
MEGEIDAAQTVLAAQDIADQIQTMIEKIADVQYKELPALQDSIRNSQGVSEAQQFTETVTDSMQELTQSLETAKSDVNDAIAVLTGQEVADPMGDLDIDGMDDDMDDDDMDDDIGGDKGAEEELGDEFDMEFEPDNEEEIAKLGRKKR